MSARLPRLLSLVVLLTLVAAPGALAAPRPAAPARDRTVPAAGPVQTSDRKGTRPVPQRWIVRLQDLPLAQAPGNVPGFTTKSMRSPSGKLLVDSALAQQYRARLTQQQTALWTTLQRAFPRAQLHRRYQIVFNGLAVTLPDANDAAIARLRALPGVKEAHAERYYQPTMFSSIPLINADKLWNSPSVGGAAKAGQGIKVAVIDSGIKIDNPFFNPAGYSYPAGFPKGDPAHTTPKVIAARAYFRPDLPPLPGEETPQPGPTGSSHGTHTAGTVGGNFNTQATTNGVTRQISGVAPRAYLMNYKVFYENESVFSGSASNIELIAALEDAVADGADVINNSWGDIPATQPAADPIVPAAEAAVDAGVVVVFSAGNEGPDPSTHGSPAYSEKVISVGATTTAQTITSGFVDVAGPGTVPENLKELPYQQAAFGPVLKDNVFGPAPYTPVAAVGGSSLACEPLPAGSLRGQIALIERGVCEFSVKVYNAQTAGAIGAIVYNSEAGGDALAIMAPGTNAEKVTIPAIFVGRSTGLGMIEWHKQHGPAARVQIDPRARVVEQTPDVLAPFSSRGPTFQGSLKPDVLAPGVNILSSGYGTGQGGAQHRGFGLVSGTSMAAPHVAGSAALLKQIHPDWTPMDIKSALMSTAASDIFLDLDREEMATTLERGAGRIDVQAAANPGLLFDRPSLSFGSLARTFGQPTRAELAVSARNLSNRPQTYKLTSESTGEFGFGITVTPATLTIPAGGTARFNVAIDIPAGSPAADYEGMVELAGERSLHLPVWTRAQPIERGPKVLLIDNDASSSLKLRDYAGFYGNALAQIGIPFTYLDVDAAAGEFQTLPNIHELQKHEIIIWFTGDNAFPFGTFPVPTPLTQTDQNLLIAYLQSGGRLIASGQDLSHAIDIDPDPEPLYHRGALYHYYMGPRFVQDDVFTRTATLDRKVLGTPNQPWAAQMVLDLSVPPGKNVVSDDKTGAGNQVSIDEVTVVDADPREPDRYTTPIFRAVSTGAAGAGIVGLNRSAEPTLEQSALGIPFRTTYLSFGLEGVRNDTGGMTRAQLLQSLLYWHVDRPTVKVNGPVTVNDVNKPTTLTATAQSNVPTTFVRYRWDFGDGSPILESTVATVLHQYKKAGTYQPRVEVTDSWGHKAISAGAPSAPPKNDPSPSGPNGQAPGAAKASTARRP